MLNPVHSIRASHTISFQSQNTKRHIFILIIFEKTKMIVIKNYMYVVKDKYR